MADVVKDIAYTGDNDPHHRLDLYLPQGKGEPPLVIWIHGGAWQYGTRADPPLGPVQAGYAMASVDFQPAGTAVFPAQIHDIKAAIRFLRARADEYGYDTDRIAVWGTSSGGHLAALAGTTGGNPQLEGSLGEYAGVDSGVQAVIDFFGPTDLLTILKQSTPHGLSVRVPALQRLLGGSPDAPGVRELARLASPVHHVDGGSPPLLILHGVQDNQVPINQSIELDQAYRRHGRDSRLVFIPAAGHTDPVYFEPACMAQVTAFLDRVLKHG
jgi:acetyl esterase/lipase